MSEYTLAPLEKLARVVLLIVEIAEAFVEILDVLEAISVSLDVMAAALVAISVSLEVMLVLLVLILDSTSDKLPKVKVPSISASLSIVTVPEVWPKDRSPVEKSP